jgi:thiamine biosynthesis lipoprotein
VRVQVDNETLIEPIYSVISEVEATFNFYQPQSELSRYNRDHSIATSEEFRALMAFAHHLRDKSGGAFTPYVEEQTNGKAQMSSELKLDFGGLAKGWAVDRAIERAQQLDPVAKGFIEAGGDIRFFGETKARVALRLGEPPDVQFREIGLSGDQMAVASSSPGMARQYGESNTTLQQGVWAPGTSVSVVAKSCAMADALTKVVLFGDKDIWRQIEPEARVFVFDRSGGLIEGYSS